jgi:hypothetical protein
MTALAKKLHLKPGMTICVLGAPAITSRRSGHCPRE